MVHFSLRVLVGGFPEKMDARLQLARMTEGGFSFIAAIHLYNFTGQCLKEEIQVLTMYVSWKFLI